MNLSTFLFKNYWLQILLAALIFGGMTYASCSRTEWHQSIAWLESIAGAGTLFFAFFLWMNSIRREWENSLQKRLTAYFEFDGRNVLVFRNILLFNESDARAWAQQVARQKAGGDIHFEPFFRFHDRRIGVDNNGVPIKKYEITFFLTAIPESLQAKLNYGGGLDKRWCLEWIQMEHEDGSITMQESPVVSAQKM